MDMGQNFTCWNKENPFFMEWNGPHSPGLAIRHLKISWRHFTAKGGTCYYMWYIHSINDIGPLLLWNGIASWNSSDLNGSMSYFKTFHVIKKNHLGGQTPHPQPHQRSQKIWENLRFFMFFPSLARLSKFYEMDHRLNIKWISVA